MPPALPARLIAHCAWDHAADSAPQCKNGPCDATEPRLQGSGTTRTREIQRRELAEPNRTLFVVNFQPETTHLDDLRRFFEQWGELDRVQLKTKFAFVQVRPCALCPCRTRTLSAESRRKRPRVRAV